MADGRYHLAQLNVARLAAPLDSPQLAGFVAALGPINALADVSPGFVWRLQDESGNATSFVGFSDDELLVNLSVWESVEQLADFVYRSHHAGVMRRRREWFVPMDEDHLVLWWISAGRLPTLEEAESRLLRLRSEGPGQKAFTFRHRFPPPNGAR